MLMGTEIFKIYASSAEKLMKTRVSKILSPTVVSPLTIIGESENPSEFPPRREFPTVGRELGPIARGARAGRRGPCSRGSGGGRVGETLEVSRFVSEI